MICRRLMFRSVTLATAMLLTMACGDGNTTNDNDSGRTPNKPPVIEKGSLAWTPADEQVQLYVPYTYSIKAYDPDVGDTISGYEWVFGNPSPAEGEIAPVYYSTTVPSVKHTFDETSVKAGEKDTVSVGVRAKDNRGAVGAWEYFTPSITSNPSPLKLTPVLPSGALTVRVDPDGTITVPVEFTLTDLDDNPVGISIAEFNPGEVAALYSPSPKPEQISSTRFKYDVSYTASTQNPTRTLTPTLRVEDLQGRSSARVMFPEITILTITTPNRTPQITITTPSTLAPRAYTSEAVTLAFTIIDEDDDSVSYTINWGDGTAPDNGIVTGTAGGANITRTHTFHDSFTNSAANAVMTITANDGRSTNGTATVTRTWTVEYNRYPVGRIASPQASETLPSVAELPSNPAIGLINPPGEDDPGIVVIPRNGHLNFVGVAEPPASGGSLKYSWIFNGGTPSASDTLTVDNVAFAGEADRIVAYLVEFTVIDALDRRSTNAPSIKPKTYRKWVVVDGVNSQTFNFALKYRQLPSNELFTVQTAANGLATPIQVFQDGSTQTFAVNSGNNQAEIVIPVRSNLPFWLSLPAIGNDQTNYVVRIPNAPVGQFADPSLGLTQLNGISSFWFQNATNPWNPTLHIVTAQGFAPETEPIRVKTLSGYTGIVDSVLNNKDERWVNMLALPMDYPLSAFPWKQTDNVVGTFGEALKTHQGVPEWPMLLYSLPSDLLPPDVANTPGSGTPTTGNGDNMGFVIEYPKYIGDSQITDTFSVLGMQTMRVPETTTDEYYLDSPPGWNSPSSTLFNPPPYDNYNRPAMNPQLVDPIVSQFFRDSVFGTPGNLPLRGGISEFSIFFDPNNPNWERHATSYETVRFYGIRTTYSYAEYLKSPHWVRPLVLNSSNLNWVDTMGLGSTFSYFRYSRPAYWPNLAGISPNNSSFDLTPSAGATFTGDTVGRFYWTAYTPFYTPTGADGGSIITRTWLADDLHQPPTTFTGGAGDATSAFGFAPPLAARVDKHSRRPDGTAIDNTYDGYRVRWFNPTRDMNGDVVPPDFWVVEFIRDDGKKFHYLLPPNFPSAAQTATDQIVTDARADNGSYVGKGYCWFDIPVELRADISNPGVTCYLTVFAVKFIDKNNPIPSARKLHGPEWIDAAKTATATIKMISPSGNDLSYAHKIPFNYAWDIVVVNGDRVIINP